MMRVSKALDSVLVFSRDVDALKNAESRIDTSHFNYCLQL